jgi:hypothetical protein
MENSSGSEGYASDFGNPMKYKPNPNQLNLINLQKQFE